MALRKLERREWHPFFDRLAAGLIGKRAEIEVASLSIGDQVAARWLPLIGIVYDPKSDVVEIMLDGVDHIVHKPKELYVDEPPFSLASLGVIDDDGVLQIVRLRAPLMLPPPRG
jgi:hypothetical protein